MVVEVTQTAQRTPTSILTMHRLLPLILVAIAVASVAELAVNERYKPDCAVEVESSGEVEDLQSGLNATCMSCCPGEIAKTKVLHQAELKTGLGIKGYTGYASFNSEREAAFAKCGAITSQAALYTSHFQLFMAWGGITRQYPCFCRKACQPPQAVHPARVIFATFISEIARESQKAGDAVLTDSEKLGGAMSPKAKAAAAILTDSDKLGGAVSPQAVQRMGKCSSGCFSGEKYVFWRTTGGQGTFCADTSKASMNVCSAKGLAKGHQGSCSSIAMQPNQAEYDATASAKLTGGTGSCLAKNDIDRIVCEGNDVWRVYLKSDTQLVVRGSKTCQVEGFAQNWGLTIDEALDHPEHGAHVEDLLVDCYRHALNEGISLVERSKRDAYHLKHQLEDRHHERANLLYDALSEENKKHRDVASGFELIVSD